jgi:Tfp pilus assembly protein PilW
MPQRMKKKGSGLTLMEIIVVTALVPLVFLTAFSFFQSSQTSFEVMEARRELDEKANRALNFLSEQLMQNGLSAPHFSVASNNSAINYQGPFENADHSISWGSTVKDGYYRIDYEASSASSGNVVWHIYDAQGNEIQRRILCDKVNEIKFTHTNSTDEWVEVGIKLFQQRSPQGYQINKNLCGKITGKTKNTADIEAALVTQVNFRN